jgi:small subunit ribosomal protein S6
LKRYEGMFLFDNTVVHEWSDMEAEVRRLFERVGTEPLVCVKFDERRLAYEIKGRKRGTYVLTYFDANPERITDLERDARLSEVVLRVLVLRADHISEERLAELKAHTPDQPLQPMSSEGRRGDGGARTRSDTSDGPEAAAAEPAKAGAAPVVATETAPAEKTHAAPKPAPKATPAEPSADDTGDEPAEEPDLS